MTANKHHIASFLSRIFLTGVCLLTFMNLFSQNHSGSYGIHVEFITKTTKQGVDKVASNVVKVVNNTNKTQELTLSVNAPMGWELIGSPERNFTVNAKDSMFFPVRIIPSKQAKGNTSYVINVMISSAGSSLASDIWYIAIDRISAWQVFAPFNKIYFANNSDTASFSLRIVNQGNSDESVLLNIEQESTLKVELEPSAIAVIKPVQIFLPVGIDTIIRFKVTVVSKSEKHEDPNGLPGKSEEKYSLKLSVKSEKSGGSKAWGGTVDFYKLNNTVKVNQADHASLPAIIEWNTYDFFRSTYSTLGLFGTAVLKKNRTLTYYYQTNFTSNYLDYNSYLGQYHFIGYNSDRIALELGNVGASRSGSNLSGEGIKASYRLGNHRVGGLYISSPTLRGQKMLDGYGATHSYRKKFISSETYYQHKNEIYQKVSSDFVTNETGFRIAEKHYIRLGGGYSIEQHKWFADSAFKLKGYSYQVQYNTFYKKFRLMAGYYFGSKNYSLLNGAENYSATFNYQLNQQNSFTISYNQFVYNPDIYVRGVKNTREIYTRKERMGVKYIRNTSNATFIIGPDFQRLNAMDLKTQTTGLEVEYRLKGTGLLRFYTTLYGGYVKPLNFDINPFFVAQARSSVRYGTFSANLRYYYGPFYTQEQVQFCRDLINPQRIFISAYHDYWFLQGKMLLKSDINYNYTTLLHRSLLSTRPEIFYHTKNGYRFSVYGRYTFYYSESRPPKITNPNLEYDDNPVVSNQFEFGAGIRKNISITATFKKFYDVKVATFRDMNGNGIQEPNEHGIGNMLIRLQSKKELTPDTIISNKEERNTVFEVVTNLKGEANFNNIPLGNYIVTATPLASTGGWFDGKTFDVMIDKDRILYIPLNRGAKVSGSIVMEREKYSKLPAEISLANIRVTAMDSAGKTYSALTNGKGEFELFLPNGRYTVVANEAVTGNRFQYLQNNIPVVLTDDFENYSISFFLVEKTRRLDVKKFDNSGNEVKDETPRPAEKVNEPNLQPENYLPVTQPTEKGKAYAVMLFDKEMGRMKQTEFVKLNFIIQVKCIQSEKGGYVYLSQSYQKERDARKVLPEIVRAGFKEAKVVILQDGKPVEN